MHTENIFFWKKTLGLLFILMLSLPFSWGNEKKIAEEDRVYLDIPEFTVQIPEGACGMGMTLIYDEKELGKYINLKDMGKYAYVNIYGTVQFYKEGKLSKQVKIMPKNQNGWSYLHNTSIRYKEIYPDQNSVQKHIRFPIDLEGGTYSVKIDAYQIDNIHNTKGSPKILHQELGFTLADYYWGLRPCGT